MDEIVKAALAKWPNVPHCHGWLGLDARGDWYMRDDATQTAGPFALRPGETGTAARGSRLQHGKLIDFIQRNYAADDVGQWYFQNGPQRVYVELEAAPYIWRVHDDGRVIAHTGAPVTEVRNSWVDELGRLFLATDVGFGLVHTSDMHAASEAVESGKWSPETIASSSMEGQWGFVLSPQRGPLTAAP